MDLTEAAQKNITHLRTKVKVQKDMINKENEVIGQKGDTYTCKRAKNTLESAERKISDGETNYENELAEIERDYQSSKASLLKKHNAYMEKQKSIIEQQLQIIDKETKGKSHTIIRCEVEIKSLEAEIQTFLDNDSNYLGGRKQISKPPPKISEPTTEPTTEPAPEPSTESDILSYKEMMSLEERLPKLTYMTPSYQYQSERQAKLPLSMREDMPYYGQKLDSTIYGPVSTLPPRPKIGVKVVPKKVINANTNVYPDTVLE
jgi:chromosome segregation ATPase